MVDIFSYNDFNRKISDIKDSLYDDGFYNTLVAVKNRTISGASGYFNRSANITYTSSVVYAIVEYGPDYESNDNIIRTQEGDVSITVRSTDANTIESADEIWLNTTNSNGIVTSYDKAVQYAIRSNKPSLFGNDKIFICNIAGRKNDN